MMPQAEWYNRPYFSVSPSGERKVARIKYNNRFAIIIPSIGQKCNPSGRILHGDPRGLFHPAARRFCAGKAAAFVARCTPSMDGKIIHNLAEIAAGFAVLALMCVFDWKVFYLYRFSR
jgi:hypothetical protein